ncbi:BBF_HP2_G0031400.mRNA.1.CDS.1 [Saccharomyces cerevisiae]|nr:BBF_HP2_G0031400.mRNA.1.CDS.1 [Saccharomyces cerevisiae]CAI6609899.1 BBF_HP2_G0031400.mRNA.1.CDS.1 [Saccharomyces cerevisiae]CAI6613444.1 BBF_HP1_G0031720.mRNA.1.CDS.1 [Saccharomyces cerevisiae]
MQIVRSCNFNNKPLIPSSNWHIAIRMRGDGVKDRSIDVLSLKHFESQKVVLPQDLFMDNFTWMFYEFFKCFTFHTWLLLLLPMWLPGFLSQIKSINRIFPFKLCILVSCLVGIFLPNIYSFSHKSVLTNQLTQFSKEIVEHAPGTDTHDWETVAANLNSYFYENKAWNTEYFFFNAAECQKAFKKVLLEPFSVKKDESSKIKSFGDSVPYIEEALQVYSAEFDKKWKLFNTEKVWSPDNLEHVQLPKKTYRYKFTWVLKRIFNLWLFPAFILFLACIYVSWDKGHLFRILCCGGGFLLMVRVFQNMRPFSMHMEDEMQFLSTIINEQESGANGWDEIAKKMNRYLFEKKVWTSEEFFFDGIDCEWFFNHFFYRLLSTKKPMFDRPLNVELWPYIKEAQLTRKQAPPV